MRCSFRRIGPTTSKRSIGSTCWSIIGGIGARRSAHPRRRSSSPRRLCSRTRREPPEAAGALTFSKKEHGTSCPLIFAEAGMGAPESGMQAAEQPEADALLSAFRTIDPAERRRHAGVLNYWLSIRGDKEFPPLHDLDPLELSDSGPCSVLLELISGGHDAEIRHVGEQLKAYVGVDKIIEAPSPSLLACIAKKLPIVAISRDFLAFEDEYHSEDGATRCWVTLLPLSAGGAWVDYVYALVSIETVPAEGAQPVTKGAKKAKVEETDSEPVEEVIEAVAEPAAEPAVEILDEVPVEDVTEVAIDEAEEPEAAAD